jgi:hypothetical protein
VYFKTTPVDVDYTTTPSEDVDKTSAGNVCKFKSKYFTEFNLNALIKPEGEALYTTD